MGNMGGARDAMIHKSSETDKSCGNVARAFGGESNVRM
jgi:hypothetical protein